MSYQSKEPPKCNKGCGTVLAFSKEHVSSTGKKIPLDAATMQPHKCPNSTFVPGQKGFSTAGESSLANRITDLEGRVSRLEDSI